MKLDPYYFDYSEVHRARAKGRKTLECRRSFEQVNIQGLVDLVEAKIDSKEQELTRLLAKLADKFDDEESLATKANEVLRLQPNLFGVGVNLNYLITNVLKARRRRAAGPCKLAGPTRAAPGQRQRIWTSDRLDPNAKYSGPVPRWLARRSPGGPVLDSFTLSSAALRAPMRPASGPAKSNITDPGRRYNPARVVLALNP